MPDTDLGRRLYDLHDLSDEHVAQIMFTKRRQETGSEFLSHEQQRIVVISVVMRSREALKVWSLGDESSTENREDVRRLLEVLLPELQPRGAGERRVAGHDVDLGVVEQRVLVEVGGADGEPGVVDDPDLGVDVERP